MFLNDKPIVMPAYVFLIMLYFEEKKMLSDVENKSAKYGFTKKQKKPERVFLKNFCYILF